MGHRWIDLLIIKWNSALLETSDPLNALNQAVTQVNEVRTREKVRPMPSHEVYHAYRIMLDSATAERLETWYRDLALRQGSPVLG